MNWTKTILRAPFSALKQASDTAGLITQPRKMARLWFLPRTRFNYAREVGDGLGSSVVVAPLFWIMRTFPEAPPMVWAKTDDGEKEEKPDHDMLRLLERPNPHYSGITMNMAMVMSYWLDGNVYLIKARDNQLRVRELWWVPSWLMEPAWREDDPHAFISWYDYRPRGISVPMRPEDVIHIRYGIDPHNTRKGLSPLRSILREVFTDDEAANFSAAILRNSGVPGVMVSPRLDDPDALPSEDEVEATKKYVGDQFTGDERGQPLVMSGPTRVEQFGFSPEQLKLREIRRIPEERVSGVFGTPAIVAGLGAGLDRSTFSNMAEAREMAYESNIIPTQRTFAEEYRHQLLTEFEPDPWRFVVGYDLSNVKVLQEDQSKEIERWNMMVQGGWAEVAEARRATGLEAGPEHEVFLRPMTMIEVPAGERGRLASEVDEGEGGEGETATALKNESKPWRIEERGGQFCVILESTGETVACHDTRQEALDHLAALNANVEENSAKEPIQPDRTSVARFMQRLNAISRRQESQFSDELEEAFERLGRQAEQAATEAGIDFSSAEGGEEKADASRVRAILAGMRIDEFREEDLKPLFEGHYERNLSQFVTTFNSMLGAGYQLSDNVARRVVREGGARVGMVDIRGTTRAALFAAIADSREAGHGPRQIARNVRNMVPAGPFRHAGARYRSEVIARTETKFAQNISSLNVYNDSEVVQQVMAFDAQAGETDEECTQRNGQLFTLEEAEAELAEEHPNGTLSFAPAPSS